MRLTAFSAESAPSYSVLGAVAAASSVRVRTASCIAYATATAASVSTLSSSAGVSPCQMLSETSTGTPAIAVAAAESGPLRIDGATPASRPPRGEDEWRDPQRPRRVCASFTRRRMPRNGSTPASNPASPRRMLASTIRTSSHGNQSPREATPRRLHPCRRIRASAARRPSRARLRRRRAP